MRTPCIAEQILDCDIIVALKQYINHYKFYFSNILYSFYLSFFFFFKCQLSVSEHPYNVILLWNARILTCFYFIFKFKCLKWRDNKCLIRECAFN